MHLTSAIFSATDDNRINKKIGTYIMKKLTIFIVCIISSYSLLGCKDKENIEIHWDEWGVPHIYAQSDKQLAYGLGWSHMHNHGNQILKLYGISSGRAAELWGREYLESDKHIWALWIPQIARQQYEH